MRVKLQQQQQRYDLHNCEKEPIHIPGFIQSHGVLLAMEADTLVINQVSGNTRSYIHLAPEDLLGRPLSSILSEDQINFLHRTLNSVQKGAGGTPYYLSHVDWGRFGLWNINLFQQDGLIILEMEPSAYDPDEMFGGQFSQLNEAFTNLQDIEGEQHFCQAVADEIRSITGYDRVMIYKFDHEWNGEIYAEAKRADLQPFLGIHYPHTDIPVQARELYRRNVIRMIPDIHYDPVQLVPMLNPATQKPLDLSLSTLRAVSPLHIEYLGNMGVVGTLVISLFLNGELWGMVACHHYSPYYLGAVARRKALLIGQIFSLMLKEKLLAAQQKAESQSKSILTGMLERLLRTENYWTSISAELDKLMGLMEAHGCILVHGDRQAHEGSVPRLEQLSALMERVPELVKSTNFFATYSGQHIPQLRTREDVLLPGFMALPLSSFDHSYLLFFRKEQSQIVYWGGDPQHAKVEEKTGEDEPGIRLSPRKSFAKWKEEVKGQSKPWTDWEATLAQEARNLLLTLLAHHAQRLENKRMQLEEKTAQLEFMHEEARAFAESIGNDLKEPLQAIRGLAEQLENGLAAPPPANDALQNVRAEQELIGNIKNRAGQLSDMLEHLLRLSSLNVQQMQVQPVNLGQVMRTLIMDAQRLYPQRKINWHMEENLHTIGDPILLKMLMQNLLSNALKFTQEREVAEISCGKLEHNGRTVFYLKDNGIGFSDHRMQELFVPFRQLHDDSKYPGHGIGLATAYRIVHRHKGRIWAESKPHMGATFYFSLWERPPEA